MGITEDNQEENESRAAIASRFVFSFLCKIGDPSMWQNIWQPKGYGVWTCYT